MILQSIPSYIPTGTYRYRALCLLDNNTKDDWHLFSVVEKLESDMQDYARQPEYIRANGSGNNKYKMYFVSCDYEVSDQYIQNPTQDIFINAGRESYQLFFFNNTFVHEPKGNAYLTLPDEHVKGIGRVMPKRNGPFHVKAYFDKERKVQNILSNEGYLLKQLEELSQKYFGIDLTVYKEHIGNSYLIWHNPIFRNFHLKYSNNPCGVIVDISYRTDKREPFIINVCDKHEFGSEVVNYSWDIPIGTRTVFIPLSSVPSLFSISVFSKDGLLIYFTEPHPFLSGISMRIGVTEKAVALTVKDENGNEIKVDPVNKFKYTDHLVGKESDDLNSFFTTNEAIHHILELADSREFLFFNGSKEVAIKNENIAKAKEAVIDILNKSNRICYLCDPYFNEKDFIEFASQFSSLDVKIRIINSKADVDVNRLLILRGLIDKYNQTIGINDYIQCRVLRGNESRLHDRFIASDNGVWYLGSSFSEFGARACSLAKLSESAALSVFQHITDWWDSDEITMPINDIVREKPRRNIRQATVRILRKLAKYLEK